MGPCMCGDPYCGSCGNPDLAKYEELEEQLMDTLNELGPPLDFYEWLVKSLPDIYKIYTGATNSVTFPI